MYVKGSEKATHHAMIFARKHYNDSQDFLENIVWTDEIKVELLLKICICYTWCKRFEIT